MGKLAPSPRGSPGWGRAAATGVAIVFMLYLALSWYLNLRSPTYADYLSFWAAGLLTLHGDPAAAYDIETHGAIVRDVAPVAEILPFPYPPPFLLFATPFSLLDYRFALPAWVLATIGVYLVGMRRIAPVPLSLSHPALLIAGFYGQASFLVTGIVLGGASLLSSRPLIGGAILGLLVIKPHLALLLPVSVLAIGAWRSIVGATVSGGALLTAALLLFGWKPYDRFLAMSATFADMFSAGWWPWQKLISPFAFLRFFGMDQAAALTLHLLVAAAAAAVTWIAWSRNWPEKLAILAAATLLGSPYLFSYDSLLLAAPLALLARRRRSALAFVTIWLLSFSPVLNHFRLYDGPNLVPIAVLVALFALAAPHLPRGAAGSEATGGAPAR